MGTVETVSDFIFWGSKITVDDDRSHEIKRRWLLGRKVMTNLDSTLGFPGDSEVKASACKCRRPGFDPWVGKIPWRRKWQLAPVFLPRKFNGQRSLVGYSIQGCRVRHDGADACTHAHTHTHTHTHRSHDPKRHTLSIPSSNKDTHIFLKHT